MPRSLRIVEVKTSRDCAALRELFEEYAAALGVPLDFQGFSEELATLPGKYQPPKGAALLATVDAAPAGCVALRPFAEGVAELKRLYVRPRFRGLGLARSMSERIIAAASVAGYQTIYLDTLAHMVAAVSLYKSLGFVERPAYYDNPIPGAVYMELRLQASGDAGFDRGALRSGRNPRRRSKGEEYP